MLFLDSRNIFQYSFLKKRISTTVKKTVKNIYYIRPATVHGVLVYSHGPF